MYTTFVALSSPLYNFFQILPESEILVVDSIPKGRLFGDLSLKMSLKKSPKTALKICLNGKPELSHRGTPWNVNKTLNPAETVRFPLGCAGRRHLRWKGRNKNSHLLRLSDFDSMKFPSNPVFL